MFHLPMGPIIGRKKESVAIKTIDRIRRITDFFESIIQYIGKNTRLVYSLKTFTWLFLCKKVRREMV